MNENQVKGKLKEAAGDVQKNVGRAVDSNEQEAKGAAREVEGKVQKKAGDVQEAANDIVKKP